MFTFTVRIPFPYRQAICQAINAPSQGIINNLQFILVVDAVCLNQAVIHIYSWHPQVCFQPWTVTCFPQVRTASLPKRQQSGSLWCWKITLVYLRGLHFRLSMVVSPDHSFQYQIARLLKLPGKKDCCWSHLVWTYLSWTWRFPALI